MKSYPAVNLGQSQFQDTFFVANAQVTPFRKLRQIELELRGIEDSLMQSSFSTRRLQLKIQKLNHDIPEDLVDIDEAKWNLSQVERMVADAHERKANFELLRDQLMEMIPAEYWERGFENAECEHWTSYVAKQISLTKAIGLPPPSNIMEMWAQLPENAQHTALLWSNEEAKRLIAMDKHEE